MHIVVASLNPVKIAAAQETFRHFKQFAKASFTSIEVPSEVTEQPLSLPEIVRGARTRAYNSFLLTKNCTLAVGIESGIVFFAEMQQHFNMAVCALYSNDAYYVGYSSGMPIPQQCMQLIIEQQLTWSQAAAHVGIIVSTNAPRSLKIPDQDVVFTNGFLSRKEHLQQSVISALIPYINTAWFEKIITINKQKELV